MKHQNSATFHEPESSSTINEIDTVHRAKSNRSGVNQSFKKSISIEEQCLSSPDNGHLLLTFEIYDRIASHIKKQRMGQAQLQHVRNSTKTTSQKKRVLFLRDWISIFYSREVVKTSKAKLK